MDNPSAPLASFESAHYITYTRDKTWYALASVVAVALLAWALLTQNYLFAFIVVIGAFIFFLDSKQDAPSTRCDILPEGILHGATLYPWKNLSTFAIIEEQPAALIVRQKKGLMSKITIPLPEHTATTSTLRDIITQFIPENDRDTMSLTESLSRIFKI